MQTQSGRNLRGYPTIFKLLNDWTDNKKNSTNSSFMFHVLSAFYSSPLTSSSSSILPNDPSHHQLLPTVLLKVKQGLVMVIYPKYPLCLIIFSYKRPQVRTGFKNKNSLYLSTCLHIKVKLCLIVNIYIYIYIFFYGRHCHRHGKLPKGSTDSSSNHRMTQ